MHIGALQLVTHKLPEQRAFYKDVLGLELVATASDAISLQAGATRLTFTQGEPACYHFAFNIPHNQFEEAKAWLAQRAELLLWDGADQVHWKAWNAHAVYCFDPAGNIIELIARHNIAVTASEPFEGASILGISEIGLAVNDVAAFSAALQSQAGLPVWDAGDGEAFTALGDEHGLFIVVRKGRAWFPTSDRYAELCPVEVTMSGETNKTIQLADLPYQFNIHNP